MHIDSVIRRDAAALRDIASGVEPLRRRMFELRESFDPGLRGYFLPDEDDQVRRLFLAYRNYRIALLDLINRYRDFTAGPPDQENQRFLLGFGAAVLLYNWSSLLICTFRDMPVVRAKLNEPDQRFGMEPDLFERIYENLTRIENLRELHRASLHFARRRHALRRLGENAGPDFTWLHDEIRRQYRLIKRSWREIFSERWQVEVSRIEALGRQPFNEMAYLFRSWVCEIFGNIWLDAVPRLPPEHLDHFRRILQPGDFFIVRPEHKTSTIFLPGFWTHAALYIGGPDQLAAAGVADRPYVRRTWPRLVDAARPPELLEALAAGVVLTSLEESMHVDHAIALRPVLNMEQRRQAIDDAFGHCGKAYDFEFDLSRSDRLVCTELIYRCLHGKGKIVFNPVTRLGKPTLNADDIVRFVLAHANAESRPLEILAVSSLRNGCNRLLYGDAAWEEVATSLG